MGNSFRKDPHAILDYKFDWSEWLTSGETLSTYSVTLDAGLTLDDSTFDNDSVTFWVSGGVDGNSYDAVCHIATSSSREDDRTARFHIRER
jgi:hypothetical protein